MYRCYSIENRFLFIEFKEHVIVCTSDTKAVQEFY